jgi:hypothetical protein
MATLPCHPRPPKHRPRHPARHPAKKKEPWRGAPNAVTDWNAGSYAAAFTLVAIPPPVCLVAGLLKSSHAQNRGETTFGERKSLPALELRKVVSLEPGNRT